MQDRESKFIGKMIKNKIGRFKCLLILVPFLLLVVPAGGYCGVIKTRILCGTEIKTNENVCLDCKIENAGTVTAYNAGFVVFIGDMAHKSGDLGDIHPGGSVNFKEDFIHPDFLPGEYVVVVRVTFEEMNGKYHRAFHFSRLLYRISKKEKVRSKLNIHMDGPVFNAKNFFKPGSAIALMFKNGYEETIKPIIHTYLPDGCSLEKPAKGYTVPPEKKEMIKVLLSMEKRLQPGSRFDAVIGYEVAGIHYSKHLKGKIIISDRPFYFQFFVVCSVFLLVVCFVIAIMLGRKKSSRLSQQP